LKNDTELSFSAKRSIAIEAESSFDRGKIFGPTVEGKFSEVNQYIANSELVY